MYELRGGTAEHASRGTLAISLLCDKMTAALRLPREARRPTEKATHKICAQKNRSGRTPGGVPPHRFTVR